MKIVLFFILSPLFLTAIYDLVFYLPSSLTGNYSDLKVLFPIYIVVQSAFFFVWAIIFTLHFSSRKKIDISCRVNVRGMPVILYWLILVICILLFLYLFYSVFNHFNFSSLILDNARFYAKSKVGTAWVFFLYQFFLYLMMYDIYKCKPNKFKLIVLFVSIILIGLTGGRSTLISQVLFIIVILVFIHGVIISKKALVLFLSFFVTIFLANAVLRGGEGSSLSKYLDSDALALDFNNSFVLQDSLDYIDSNNDHYLVAAKDLFYAFIPRKVYPVKPVSTAETRLVYPDFLSDGRTTNITFGVYGNALINFGYLGLLVIPLIMMCFGYMYYHLMGRLVMQRPVDFLLLYFFVFFILVLRGGIFNSRIFLIYVVLCFSVLVYETVSRLKWNE